MPAPSPSDDRNNDPTEATRTDDHHNETTDESSTQTAPDALVETIDDLRDHIAALEDELATLSDRVTELEAENDTLRAENERLRDRTEMLEENLIEIGSDVDDLQTDVERHDEQIVTGVRGRRDLHEALAELQTRELEKGAHLQDDHVDPHHITGTIDHLERIEKEKGTYVAMPGADDPLSHGGEAHLRQEDLLPIQQVARLDDDMLAGETKPVQMAVAAWQERREDRYGLWSEGCGSVRQYLDASDMQDLIRRRSTSISESYCEKLAQRAFEALVDLSNNRCYVKKRTRRQDGLQYKETRLVLPADADIPGERRSFSDGESADADGAGDGAEQADAEADGSTTPQTVDVAG